LPDAITIRPLAPEDSISVLTALLHRAYAPLAAQGLRYLATHQSDDVTRDRVALGQCFVVLAGDALVGTILFRPAVNTKGSPWYNRPDVASIGQFAVEPSLQSRGLGLRLVTTAEQHARAKGVAELALDTAEPATHLIDWYTRLGYRFIEHAQWGHTNYRSVILSKTLA
jgi:GNAT superfamily N-acetyltransferase